jgi:hypothetical protein
MCARFRARGLIRNTIVKRFPDRCRDFRSDMSMSRSSAGDARAGRISRARGQRLLGEPELSQLRRLCDGGFSLRPRQAARTGPSPTLCCDVCGGSVVALPPPDHHRLFARRRRTGVPYPWTGLCHASRPDEVCHAAAGRSAYLSARAESSGGACWEQCPLSATLASWRGTTCRPIGGLPNQRQKRSFHAARARAGLADLGLPWSGAEGLRTGPPASQSDANGP